MIPGKCPTTPDEAPCRSPGQLVEALRGQIARLETSRRQGERVPLSSGCEGLDRLLPDRRFHRGSLVEWLLAGEGSGGETLALIAARQACREGGVLLVLDQSREFYPPAAIGLGIELDKTIVVQTASAADNLWALDQALRCPAVAAALAWPQKLEGQTFRRLQLAAEQGGSLGLLIRPESARREPSWAEVRLLVEPLPAPRSAAGRRLKVRLLRSRGGTSGGSVEVEIDNEAGVVRLVPPLADPTARRRAAGA